MHLQGQLMIITWYNTVMDYKIAFAQSGIRKTPARTAIFSFLGNADRPVSIEEICANANVKKLSLDLVTVYRTIHSFVEKGVVRQIDFHEGKFRYELSNMPHHHHIVCTQCGSVQDVEDCLKESAEDAIQKQTGYTITSHALEFFGVCKKCK